LTSQPTIKPLNIHGKDYIQVSDRIRLCHADEGFTMVSQERYELNGRFFFSVCIEVKGKRYYGDAEITFSASPRTPAGSNPLETAQTSALGRALGLAGYGVIESIASADEVCSAIIRQQEADVQSSAPDTDAPQETLDAIKANVKALGLATDSAGWATWKKSVLKRNLADVDLQMTHLRMMRIVLEREKTSRTENAA
jgi:hypothetical protein